MKSFERGETSKRNAFQDAQQQSMSDIDESRLFEVATSQINDFNIRKFVGLESISEEVRTEIDMRNRKRRSRFRDNLKSAKNLVELFSMNRDTSSRPNSQAPPENALVPTNFFETSEGIFQTKDVKLKILISSPKEYMGFHPFNVKDQVEVRFFEDGFKGAWMRCTILSIKWDKNNSEFDEFFIKFNDFELQEPTWISLYSKHPDYDGYHLMIRPKPPEQFYYDQVKSKSFKRHSKSSEHNIFVFINRDFYKNDIVDWWENYCWWTEKIIQKQGAKFLVRAPLPPLGEGMTELGNKAKFRVSLVWDEGKWEINQKKNGRRNSHIAKIDYYSNYLATPKSIVARHEVRKNKRARKRIRKKNSSNELAIVSSDNCLNNGRSFVLALRASNQNANMEMIEYGTNVYMDNGSQGGYHRIDWRSNYNDENDALMIKDSEFTNLGCSNDILRMVDHEMNDEKNNTVKESANFCDEKVQKCNPSADGNTRLSTEVDFKAKGNDSDDEVEDEPNCGGLVQSSDDGDDEMDDDFYVVNESDDSDDSADVKGWEELTMNDYHSDKVIQKFDNDNVVGFLQPCTDDLNSNAINLDLGSFIVPKDTEREGAKNVTDRNLSNITETTETSTCNVIPRNTVSEFSKLNNSRMTTGCIPNKPRIGLPSEFYLNEVLDTDMENETKVKKSGDEEPEKEARDIENEDALQSNQLNDNESNAADRTSNPSGNLSLKKRWILRDSFTSAKEKLLRQNKAKEGNKNQNEIPSDTLSKVCQEFGYGSNVGNENEDGDECNKMGEEIHKSNLNDETEGRELTDKNPSGGDGNSYCLNYKLNPSFANSASDRFTSEIQQKNFEKGEVQTILYSSDTNLQQFEGANKSQVQILSQNTILNQIGLDYQSDPIKKKRAEKWKHEKSDLILRKEYYKKIALRNRRRVVRNEKQFLDSDETDYSTSESSSGTDFYISMNAYKNLASDSKACRLSKDFSDSECDDFYPHDDCYDNSRRKRHKRNHTNSTRIEGESIGFDNNDNDLVHADSYKLQESINAILCNENKSCNDFNGENENGGGLTHEVTTCNIAADNEKRELYESEYKESRALRLKFLRTAMKKRRKNEKLRMKNEIQEEKTRRKEILLKLAENKTSRNHEMNVRERNEYEEPTENTKGRIEENLGTDENRNSINSDPIDIDSRCFTDSDDTVSEANDDQVQDMVLDVEMNNDNNIDKISEERVEITNTIPLKNMDVHCDYASGFQKTLGFKDILISVPMKKARKSFTHICFPKGVWHLKSHRKGMDSSHWLSAVYLDEVEQYLILGKFLSEYEAMSAHDAAIQIVVYLRQYKPSNLEYVKTLNRFRVGEVYKREDYFEIVVLDSILDNCITISFVDLNNSSAIKQGISSIINCLEIIVREGKNAFDILRENYEKMKNCWYMKCDDDSDTNNEDDESVSDRNSGHEQDFQLSSIVEIIKVKYWEDSQKLLTPSLPSLPSPILPPPPTEHATYPFDTSFVKHENSLCLSVHSDSSYREMFQVEINPLRTICPGTSFSIPLLSLNPDGAQNCNVGSILESTPVIKTNEEPVPQITSAASKSLPIYNSDISIINNENPPQLSSSQMLPNVNQSSNSILDSTNPAVSASIGLVKDFPVAPNSSLSSPSLTSAKNIDSISRSGSDLSPNSILPLASYLPPNSSPNAIQIVESNTILDSKLASTNPGVTPAQERSDVAATGNGLTSTSTQTQEISLFASSNIVHNSISNPTSNGSALLSKRPNTKSKYKKRKKASSPFLASTNLFVPYPSTNHATPYVNVQRNSFPRLNNHIIDINMFPPPLLPHFIPFQNSILRPSISPLLPNPHFRVPPNKGMGLNELHLRNQR